MTPNRKKKMENLDDEARMLLTGKKDGTPGRPPKEDNDAVIDAICRISIPGSAVHEKRRSDIIRTVKTVDQLTNTLKVEGFTLQRSSVYLRFLPKNARTTDGKRHVNPSPVKLSRSQSSPHKDIHPQDSPNLQSGILRNCRVFWDQRRYLSYRRMINARCQ